MTLEMKTGIIETYTLAEFKELSGSNTIEIQKTDEKYWFSCNYECGLVSTKNRAAPDIDEPIVKVRLENGNTVFILYTGRYLSYQRLHLIVKQLAILDTVLGKKIFTRPTKGDIFIAAEWVRNSCYVYVANSYYETLKTEILTAYKAGRLPKKYPIERWKNFISSFLTTVLVENFDTKKLDDYLTVIEKYWD